MTDLNFLPAPHEINAIVLDLGGVIINIDYQLPVKAFAALGIPDFNTLYGKAAQSSLFDDFETGKISAADFIHQIRILSGLELSDAQIRNAWNAILLDFPEERIHFLMKLKEKYPLYLLSNTNAIHVEAFTKQVTEQFGRNVLAEVFLATYYSNEIGRRKPNRDAFEFVLEQNNLLPPQTLFVDDSPQHIEGARACGMRAMHVAGNRDLCSLLESYL